MKHEKTWLTVIIPIYNAEKYLRKCLDSIISQSFDNYEVILVDDGSTDKSPDICREYSSKDNRFRYFRTENQGVLAARIYGAKLADSTYFTYCDADDFYVNNRVFQLLFDKITNVAEDISVVQFGFFKKYNHIRRKVQLTKQDCIVDADKFYSNEYPKFLCSFWEPSHLTMSVWNKLYNHNLLKYLPVKAERVFWGDDLILNLHLLQSITSAFYLSDALYVYQQDTGNTKKFSIHTMQDLDIIKKNQLKFLEKRTGDDTAQMKKILYSEIAAWFLSYLREAKNHLNDSELKELISDSLALPSFRSASQYYKQYPEDWEGAILLKQADYKDYLIAADSPIKKSIKTINALKALLKRI